MNPLVGARAVYGLALPVAMALTAFDRRRARRERDAAREPTRADEPKPVGPALPRLRRRRLRALASQHGDLRDYDLRRAALGGLHLAGIDLSGTDLTSASFRTSDLRGVSLSGAVLDHADLSACDLRGADLTRASLLETDFAGADVGGVDFTGCRHAAMVNLRGARFDRHTRLPAGVDPLYAGAVRTGR